MLTALGWGRRRAVLTVVLGATVASLAVPGQSFAATVKIVNGTRILFAAGAGERNFVTVDAIDTASNTYTIHDTGTLADFATPVTLTAEAPCTPAGATAVTCSAAGIRTIAVNLKDQDDTVNMNADPSRSGTWISGGEGNDNINGGPGNDQIYAGAGWDQVSAFAGDDLVDSGPGGTPGDPTVDIPGEWMRGGGGSDTITYANRQAALIMDLSEHDQAPYALDPADTPDPSFPFERVDGFEKVIATAYDDFLVGSILSDTFVGGEGSDVMCGGLGQDTVDYSDHDAGHPVSVSLTGNPAAPNQTTLSGPLAASGSTIAVESTAGFPTSGTLNIDSGQLTEQFTYTGTTETTFTGVKRGQHTTVAVEHASGAIVYDPSFFPQTDPRTTFGLAGSGFETDQYKRARVDCRSSGYPNPFDIPVASYPDFYVRDAHQNDCAYDDGNPDYDGSKVDDTIKGDCVGEDIENVVGGDGNDTLTGNDTDPLAGGGPKVEPLGANTLQGGKGDDVLDGRGGPDALEGGPGSDTASYADRTERVQASLDGAANDGNAEDVSRSGVSDRIGPDVENITGGSANDVLVGDANGNTLSGGGGVDAIRGNSGDDTLDGGEGDDSLDAGDGNDGLSGGAGNDSMKGGFGADTFDGGDGSDTVDFSDATTPVFAAPDGVKNDGPAGEGDNLLGGVENLVGGSDNDTLVGNEAPGTLIGGPGNDTLDGGGGADHIVGGGGLDVASYASRTGSVSVDLLAPGTAGEPGENDTVDADVEGVAGGSAGDTIAGSDGVNLLFGGGGNDTISGRGSDDQIFGGDGNDVLNGDAGGDKITGDAGDDKLQGGADSDSLNGGDGNDQLDGGPAADVFIGGPGNDTALYSARTKGVAVTLDGADNDGESAERDQIRATVESTKTGAGGDKINVRDGLAGDVSCGGGRDRVTADMVDKIADDCEQKNVISTATCSVRSGSAALKSNGVVGIRVTCPVAGKGKLTLQTSGAYTAAKKTRKKVTLGRKSFKLKAGRSKTIKVKLSKKARRLVRKNKRLHVRATVAVKAASASNTTKRSKTLTIKAGKRKK